MSVLAKIEFFLYIQGVSKICFVVDNKLQLPSVDRGGFAIKYRVNHERYR